MTRAESYLPPLRGRLAHCLLAVLLLSAVSAVFAVTASADSRIGGPSTYPEYVEPGGVSSLTGVAVSAREGGDVWVLNGGRLQRVDEFEPDGTFVRAFGWGVRDGSPELQTCTTATGCHEGEVGSGPGQFNWADAIAVDNSCAEQEPPLTGSSCETFDPAYGDIYLVDQRNFRVEKLDPSQPEIAFDLMFGGDVDKTPGTLHPNLCAQADLEAGDICGAGLSGTGAAHFYNGTAGSWAGEGAWGFHNSVAVGPEGTVYVGDYGRIQEFEPSGAFLGEIILSVEPGQQPQFVTSLALDRTGDIFARSATYSQCCLVSEVPGVREFDASGGYLRTFDAEAASDEPTHLALDAEGNLFLADRNGGEVSSFTFRGFHPDGDLFAEFNSPEITPLLQESNDGVVGGPLGPSLVPGIGIDTVANRLYATTQETQVGRTHVAAIALPVPGPPLVGEESAAQLEPTTVTIHAALNPNGFHTEYRLQYVTQGAWEAEGFANPQQTSLKALSGIVITDHQVQVQLSGLLPHTSYHYRFLASNEKGTTPGADQTFETLPPISIREFTTQTVGPELVTLKAELSPNNGSGTRYTISYGVDEACSSGSQPGELHVLGGEFEEVTATFEHLHPNTDYHYCLAASNSYGEPVGADSTFTTEETIAEENARAGCPNSTLREENSSLALPDCRAYERVSPSDKSGYAVNPPSLLAPSGERAAFNSNGAFAAVQAGTFNAYEYVAHRTPGGWLTQATVADPLGPEMPSVKPINEFDSGLDHWLLQLSPGPTVEYAALYEEAATLFAGAADGSFSPASPRLTPLEGPSINAGNAGWAYNLGAAGDYSPTYIGTWFRLLASDARPDAGARPFVYGFDRIYEAEGENDLALAAELPPGLHFSEGSTFGQCILDRAFGWRTPWASVDGRTLFYTSPIENAADQPCGEGTPNPIGLFARTRGEGAAMISQLNVAPAGQCHDPSPCAGAHPISPAYFGAGATPDGSRVWFTTRQPLVDSDQDPAEGEAGNDLYLGKLSGGQLVELVQASAGTATDPTPGAGAGVKSVVAISPDGQHSAYVATGVLTTEPDLGTGQAAVQGADNLYLFDSGSGETHFIARLCSGPELSGSTVDSSCDRNLETGAGSTFGNHRNDSGLFTLEGVQTNNPPVQFAAGGDHLLFLSYGRLTADDTDGAPDVFRYDAQSRDLNRVSISRRGNDAAGNDNRYPAAILTAQAANLPAESPAAAAGDSSRAISADGSRVVFTTAAPLVSRDADSAPDVYEWEEDRRGTCEEPNGCVSLISDGHDPHGVEYGVISNSGRDVSFRTSRGLAPTDTDGLGDIYDARIEGGFPYFSAQIPCGGIENCLEKPGEQRLLPGFTSQETHSGGNGPRELKCANGKHRVRKHAQVRCVPRKPQRGHRKKRRHRRSANSSAPDHGGVPR